MYYIGICDDGENNCCFFDRAIRQYAGEKNLPVDINVWYTGESLKQYLEQGNHLDLLFLDIRLWKMTGIEVGQYIRNELDNARIQIVYISGHSSYARQLFKTQPLDFLVKPITEKEIEGTLDTAFRKLKQTNETLEFQQGKDYYYIPLCEIVYLQSDGRKIKVITPKNNFEFYGKLKKCCRACRKILL